MRKTKIIATIGPSTFDENIIKELILSGVNAFRFNFSHGTHTSHGENFHKVRAIASNLNTPVAIIQDLAGPKIRIGDVVKPFNVRRGDHLCILKDCPIGNSNNVGINHPELLDKLSLGCRIYLADGQIAFKAIQKVEGGFLFEALNNGVVSSRKGLNFPDVEIDLPALSQKDQEDVKFAIQIGFDYIALSFVKNKSDILLIKNLIASTNASIPVIAKIEKHESLKNIDEIIDTADAIMIARGDLGIEVDIEKIPVIQKEIIHKCNKKGKPVITATQMLTSMIFNIRPTRAEVNDIGNAVLDGSDALMLSDETAIGNYPLEVIQTMVKTIEHTELIYNYYRKIDETKIDTSIAYASCGLADNLKAKLICVFTKTGASARNISMCRPHCDVFANVYDVKTYNSLSLVWGITPYLIMKDDKNLEKMLGYFVKEAFRNELIGKSHLVVAIMGYPAGKPGSTNLIRVLRDIDFERYLNF
jgi:pyruvate kinase